MSTMPVNYQTSKFLLPIFLPIPAKKMNWKWNWKKFETKFLWLHSDIGLLQFGCWGKMNFSNKKLWKLKEALSFTNFLYYIEIHNLVLSYIKHNLFTHLYSYLNHRGSLLNLYCGTKIFAKWVKLVRTLELYWKIELEQKVSLIIVV